MINENIISIIKGLPTKELIQIARDMNNTTITDISRSYLAERFQLNEGYIVPMFLITIAPVLSLELSNRIPLAFEAGREKFKETDLKNFYKYTIEGWLEK